MTTTTPTTTLSKSARELVERPIIANVATVDTKGRPQIVARVDRPRRR